MQAEFEFNPLLKSFELLNAQLWSSFDKRHCSCLYMLFYAFNSQLYYRFPDLSFHNPLFFGFILALACLSSCLSLCIHLMILYLFILVQIYVIQCIWGIKCCCHGYHPPSHLVCQWIQEPQIKMKLTMFCSPLQSARHKFPHSVRLISNRGLMNA